MSSWRSPWMDWKPKGGESGVSGVSAVSGVSSLEGPKRADSPRGQESGVSAVSGVSSLERQKQGDWPRGRESAVSAVSSSDASFPESIRKKDILNDMPRAREENENPHTPFQRTDSTDTTPRVTYYEDAGERWFREDGRFWFEDKATGERTELVPGNPPENEPLPGAFFEAFGRLLGYVARRKAKPS